MEEQGLNANALKMIGIAAMTIDHIAWIFSPGYRTDISILALHIIGRLTAPIMMFFIIEGYYHTKNLKRYIARMFIFAVISHFAYALMFNKSLIPFQNSIFDQTSIMWTFALGLLALAINESANPKLKQWHKAVLVWICLWAAFPADWSTPAAAAIFFMGQSHKNFKKQMCWFMLWMTMYAAIYAIFLDVVYGLLQLFVVLAVPLLRLYNGKRGNWKGMKWFFYIYYPLHLIILGLVRIFVLS